MTWDEWRRSRHGLYLTCDCGWAKDVDPDQPGIQANGKAPLQAVVKGLPCPACGRHGLAMSIVSPWK